MRDSACTRVRVGEQARERVYACACMHVCVRVQARAIACLTRLYVRVRAPSGANGMTYPYRVKVGLFPYLTEWYQQLKGSTTLKTMESPLAFEAKS